MPQLEAVVPSGAEVHFISRCCFVVHALEIHYFDKLFGEFWLSVPIMLMLFFLHERALKFHTIFKIIDVCSMKLGHIHICQKIGLYSF